MTTRTKIGVFVLALIAVVSVNMLKTLYAFFETGELSIHEGLFWLVFFVALAGVSLWDYRKNRAEKAN